MIDDKLIKIKNYSMDLANQLVSFANTVEAIESADIKIEPTADGFHGCLECIHSSDSESICVLRKCKHALHQLKECYKKG